jgi:uncharacterized membrane protein YbhN (UPF0104 family)
MKKTLIIAAKVLIVAIVAYFIRDSLAKAWRQIGEHPWPIDPLWLVLSGAIYLAGLLPAGWFWHHILKTLGQEAGLGETLLAYYIGHLGKYVPGKAMVVILRTGLIRSHRVDTKLAVVSVFYETLTMMAVGSFLAAGILAFRLHEERTMFWGSIAFMLLAGLPTLPPIFRLILRVMRVSPRPMGEGQGVRADVQETPDAENSSPQIKNLTYKTLAVGWLSMFLVWAGMAASLWAVFRSLGLPDCELAGRFPDYTAAVSLSVVAGFLAFIPGGLGVRDMILAVLLVRLFQIADAPAALASGLLRLVWLVAELIVFGVLYPIRLKSRREKQANVEFPRSPSGRG